MLLTDDISVLAPDAGIFGRRALRRLAAKHRGITTIGQLIALRPDDILEIPLVGHVALNELCSALAKHGCFLRGALDVRVRPCHSFGCTQRLVYCWHGVQ